MSENIPELNDESKTLYMRVYGYYRELITNGKLRSGARLPSVRRCAAELNVSRTTVESAYLQLAADGYIISKPQSGYFVTNIAAKPKKNIIYDEKSKNDNEIVYDFSSLKADRESFDFDLWRRYLKSALRQDDRLLSYGDAQGERELREVIADYIGEKRNVVCNAEDIVIGAGVQSLLHILCSITAKDKKIAFQDKSFVQGIAIFKDHGFCVTQDEKTADILYTSPSHINRWGDVMPTADRLEMIKQAQKNGTLIIEDDYDSEFGYFNHPTPSLQGLDGGKTVVYLGTFSKLLLPSIRISFMILPEALSQKYRQKAFLYNQTVSTTEQIALCQFIRDGHLSGRIRKVKKLYTLKMMQLNSAVKEVFGKKAKTYIGETGFVIRAEIFSTLSVSQIVDKAKQAGIAVMGAEQTDGNPQIMLSCSSVKAEDFNKAVTILKNSIFTDDK